MNCRLIVKGCYTGWRSGLVSLLPDLAQLPVMNSRHNVSATIRTRSRGMNSSGSGQRAVARFCEHDNVHTDPEDLYTGVHKSWVLSSPLTKFRTVAPQCWICSIRFFWHLEFRGGSQTFWKFVQPCFRQSKIKELCSFRTSGTDYSLTPLYILLIGILNHTSWKPSTTWLQSSKLRLCSTACYFTWLYNILGPGVA